MSFRNALVSQLLNQKKYQALQEYLHIEFPEKQTVLFQEYAGTTPRLYSDMKNDIVLMMPTSMEVWMENAVVDAIENGTIFDDAENVKNSAEYIRMTALPYKGVDHEPTALKSAVGSVIGIMGPNGRFGSDETDLQNGYTAMKDMMQHANDSDMATHKLIKDYIHLKDNGKLPIEYRRMLGKVKYDVKEMDDVPCENCLTANDYTSMKLTDECGSICASGDFDAYKEFDSDGASGESIAADKESVFKDQSCVVDEDANDEFGTLGDDTLDGGAEDIAYDESFELDYSELDKIIMEADEASESGNSNKIADAWDKFITWVQIQIKKINRFIVSSKMKLRINHIRKAIKQGKVIKVPRSDINEEEFSKLFKKILEWMDPDNDDYDFTTVFAMHNGDVSELIQNIDIANKCLLDDIKFMTSEESGLAHFTNSEVEDVIGFAEWKIDKIKDSFKRQIFNMNLYKKFDNWEIVKDVTMKYLELVTNVLRDEYTWLKRAKIVDPTTKRGDDEVNEYFALDDIINMTDEVVVEFDAGQAVQNGKAAVKDAGQQVKIWFKKMIANLVYNYNKLSLKSQLSYAQKMADKINHGANYKFQAHIIDPSTMKTLPDSKECAGIQAKSRELFRFFNTLGNSVEDIERLTGIADELIGVYKDDIITVSGIMKNSEWVDMSSDGVYESIDKLKEKVKELDTIIAEVKHALVLEKIWVDENI